MNAHRPFADLTKDWSPERHAATAARTALLKRELEQGLASGVSKRSPEQVRAAFRKAR